MTSRVHGNTKEESHSKGSSTTRHESAGKNAHALVVPLLHHAGRRTYIPKVRLEPLL